MRFYDKNTIITLQGNGCLARTRGSRRRSSGSRGPKVGFAFCLCPVGRRPRKPACALQAAAQVTSPRLPAGGSAGAGRTCNKLFHSGRRRRAGAHRHGRNRRKTRGSKRETGEGRVGTFMLYLAAPARSLRRHPP